MSARQAFQFPAAAAATSSSAAPSAPPAPKPLEQPQLESLPVVGPVLNIGGLGKNKSKQAQNQPANPQPPAPTTAITIANTRLLQAHTSTSTPKPNSFSLGKSSNNNAVDDSGFMETSLDITAPLPVRPPAASSMKALQKKAEQRVAPPPPLPPPVPVSGPGSRAEPDGSRLGTGARRISLSLVSDHRDDLDALTGFEQIQAFGFEGQGKKRRAPSEEYDHLGEEDMDVEEDERESAKRYKRTEENDFQSPPPANQQYLQQHHHHNAEIASPAPQPQVQLAPRRASAHSRSRPAAAQQRQQRRTSRVDELGGVEHRAPSRAGEGSGRHGHQQQQQHHHRQQAQQQQPEMEVDPLSQILNMDVSAHVAQQVGAYQAAVERWSSCTEEEWLKGADEIAKKFVGVLDFVKDHVKAKNRLYASLTDKLSEHKSVLADRANELAAARQNLVKESGSVVGAQYGGGGRR